MSLLITLTDDLKTAMKAKELVRRDILRFVIAQIKNKQIAKMSDLSDDEIMKVIQKEVKQIQETKESLVVVGDAEGIAGEESKIAVLSVYLPQMLSRDELQTIVKATIASSGIEDFQKGRGQLIGMIMKEHGAAADGRLLNEIISSL